MLRVLTFTSLFPNAEQSRHGIFVETRLRKLIESGQVQAKVLAPVPWFPFTGRKFGRFGAYARVKPHESRNGLDVLHPRFLSIPGFSGCLNALTMALGALPTVRAMLKGGFDFDVIDAHYYYPDGVAAALIAKWVGKPLIITARGSDITFWPTKALPRGMIRWAGRYASRNVAVSRALSDEMLRLGFDADKQITLRNGVDLELFFPMSQDEARAELGVRGIVLISVGNLIELKGHHLAIEAVARIPGSLLLIVGTGPEEGRLRALAQQLGVTNRVRFVGVVVQAQLRTYYSAADMLLLPSRREGWPNVLLESMACGTPVIATRAWGIPEVVTSQEAGVLMDGRSVDALVGSIAKLLQSPPSRTSTRAYAERHSWGDTSAGLLAILSAVTGRGEAATFDQFKKTSGRVL